MGINNAPHCWTNPLPKDHHASLRWKGLVEEQQLECATSNIESSEIARIAYRLVNRPSYAPKVAAIMYQLGNAEQTFWLSCLEMTSGKRSLISALVKKARFVLEGGVFRAAFYNSVQLDLPELASIPAIQNKLGCTATRRRVVIRDMDMDDCFLFHLCWELKVVSSLHS